MVLALVRLQQALQCLFPCQWGDCPATWGCRCGKKKTVLGKSLAGLATRKSVELVSGKKEGSKKEGSKTETRAADLERQAQQRATVQAEAQRAQSSQLAETERQRASQLALEQRQQAESGRARLIKEFARTPEEAQILQDLRRRAGLSGEQLFRETGPISAQLADTIQRQVGLSGEQLFRETGPTSAQLDDLIRQRLTTPPQIPFESTLKPALELARQNVESQFLRRGITPTSGLALEGLGRAGVDLAIREAQAREQNRVDNERLIQETLNRAGALTQASSGLSQEALGRAGALSQFSSGLGAEAIGAETDFEKALRDQELRGVDLGERSLQAGLGRGFVAGQGGLERGFSAQESGLSRAAQRQEFGERQASDFAQSGLQALLQREEAARQRRAAIAQALGGVALGAATGGIGAAFPALGTAAGLGGIAGVGGGFGGALRGAGAGALRSLAGLPVGESLVERLLNEMRGGGRQSIFSSPSGNLSGNLSFFPPMTDEERLRAGVFRRG